MQKNQSPSLQTQENVAVEKFAKCCSFVRKSLDDSSYSEELKELVFQKYSAIAKMLCQSGTKYNDEYIKEFVRIING